MFYYSIYDHENEEILMHEKKFTKEEFDKFCKIAKEYYKESYLDMINIPEYLIKNYGFQEVICVARFNIVTFYSSFNK